jgi:hypothetical protein
VTNDLISYDICLPFHILVYYKRHAKCFMAECEKYLLDDVIVLAFNALCLDAKFVGYLVNESDFIEIIMSEISSCLGSLPVRLEPLEKSDSYNLRKQLSLISPLLLKE